MTRQKGQVALIVLIISAISLTIGLALSERVRTGVNVSKDDEMLQRAFNAAESGIEDYVVRGNVGTYNAGDATANVVVTGTGGLVVEFGELVTADNYAYFWLAEHNANGSINTTNNYYSGSNLTICYDNFSPGGFMVYYFYYSGGTYNVYRRAYNLNGSNQAIRGAETVGASGTACSGYTNSMLFDFTSYRPTPVLLVVKPIRGGSKFAVRGNADLPSQGDLITSTGTSGETNTTVKVMKRWDPSMYMFFMLEGIVSRSTIN